MSQHNKLQCTGPEFYVQNYSTACCYSCFNSDAPIQYRISAWRLAAGWLAEINRLAGWLMIDLAGWLIDNRSVPVVILIDFQSIDQYRYIHCIREKSIFASAVRPFWATKETYWKSTIRSRTSMENTLSDSTTPLLKLDFPLYVLEKIITMRDLFYPCVRISRSSTCST